MTLKQIESGNGMELITRLGQTKITIEELKEVLNTLPNNAILTTKDGSCIYNIQEIVFNKKDNEVMFSHI